MFLRIDRCPGLRVEGVGQFFKFRIFGVGVAGSSVQDNRAMIENTHRHPAPTGFGG